MVFNGSKNDKIIRMNITENHNNTNEIYENIWKYKGNKYRNEYEML